MRVVVDANLVAALVIPLPYSDQASEKIVAWKRAGEELHAPVLLEYEVASILRKAVAADLMSTDVAVEAMCGILALDIQGRSPTAKLHESALRWAERLGQSKAYDAQYLSVAEELGAELWTADRRLADGARQVGVPWVHWIGEVT